MNGLISYYYRDFDGNMKSNILHSIVGAIVIFKADEQSDGNDSVENKRFFEFLNLLQEYIRDLDADMKEYSPSKLKIIMELNGFNIDESYHYLMKLKQFCVDRRIGVINIMKPIDWDNIYVSILEF